MLCCVVSLDGLSNFLLRKVNAETMDGGRSLVLASATDVECQCRLPPVGASGLS